MSTTRRINCALACALAMALLAGGASASTFRFGSTKFFIEEPELAVCLTNFQVRKAVAAAGYSDIFLDVPNDDHIQVKASQAGSIFLLDFNRCTGQIEDVALLR